MFEPKVMEADGLDYVFPFHFGMIFRLHVSFQVVHSTETMSSILVGILLFVVGSLILIREKSDSKK